MIKIKPRLKDTHIIISNIQVIHVFIFYERFKEYRQKNSLDLVHRVCIFISYACTPSNGSPYSNHVATVLWLTDRHKDWHTDKKKSVILCTIITGYVQVIFRKRKHHARATAGALIIVYSIFKKPQLNCLPKWWGNKTKMKMWRPIQSTCINRWYKASIWKRKCYSKEVMTVTQ